MKVKPIPDGYHSVTPYLIVKGATQALGFYRDAFGAEVLVRMDWPGGLVGHAEIRIGSSIVMLADEFPDMGIRSPQTLGGSGFSLMVYVEDVDTAFPRALAAGAVELRPLEDQFYGDRSGTLRDPFGHVWTLASHVEDVAPDELKRRSKALFQ
jgi:PhnB protein